MSEWISAKDRLPEIKESVLVADKNKVYVGFYGKAGYLRDDSQNRWYMDNTDWDGMPGEYNVTHWMPLPQPPKV